MMWTPDQVWERVQEAFQTFSRLPGEWPAEYQSSMPETLAEAQDVFAIAVDEGGYRATVVRSHGGAPTGEMIDRAVEVFEWCLRAKLKPGLASWICLWGSAAGYGAGGRVCRRMNISRPTLRKYRRKALREIVEYLGDRDAQKSNNAIR